MGGEAREQERRRKEGETGTKLIKCVQHTDFYVFSRG